ncbi:MAG: hypothetical protein ACR2MX_03415, partial [Cyclobacteriaceae bacterium]
LQFLALATAMALLSCSSDDETAVVAPVLSFNDVNLETPFFTEGATETPSLEWNGAVGTLSLDGQIQGVSLDATDGTIEWDKSLPLGLNDVKVVATNSAGTNAVTIQIDNQFTGDFIGGYNTDPESELLSYDFELKFNADGTMNVMDGGEAIASGTWSLSGTTFTSVYTYNSSGTYSLIMDIIHSDTEARIEGYWYDGDNPAAGNERGFIKLDL